MSEEKFSIGDEVRLQSRPERVGVVSAPAPQRIAGQWWYTVYFGPGKTGRHPESDLDLFRGSTEDVANLLRSGLFSGREALTKLLCHLRLSTRLRSQIYSLAASRTTFLPYQFKPVLKFLDSRRHRLLIADEVGLGKTIEAGLILTELRHRRPLRRVLIVPPAHLLIKWRDEMRNRFDLQFDILDSRGAQEFLRQYEREGDETPLRGILSLQSLRGSRLLERWEAVSPTLDFVVFDEAGRLRRRETRSHAAAALLGTTADAMILLTATPVQTGDDDLFNLLQLLDPEDFASSEVFRSRLEVNRHVLEGIRRIASPTESLASAATALRRVEETHLARWFLGNPLYQDLVDRLRMTTVPTRRERIELQRDLNGLSLLSHVLSRTRKREVQESQPVRRARLFNAEPTSAEQEFYSLVTALARSAYARSGNDRFAAFATMMPQRQAASCMVAMVDYCLQKFGPAATGVDVSETSDLAVEDFDFDPDGRPRTAFDWTRLGDLRRWRQRLAEHDSKWEALRGVIGYLDKNEPNQKIIIYSFFKRTLAYLHERLEGLGIQSVLITGDVPSVPDDPDADERGRRLMQFRDDRRARILLSTEVGDEGLDLQFAHIIVNYDLPWNPMRVEQRIGRIDRIGQESKYILVLNLSMPGTIEDRVLTRLYERIKIFERSIGDLDAIVGEEVRRLTEELFSRDLAPAEEEQRIEQAAMAIENHRLAIDRWDEAASALIGHDEFFLDEIIQARERRRYPGGAELLIYLRDYLADYHPECTIESTSTADIWRLMVEEDLREFLRASVPSEDVGLRTFLHRSNRGEVLVTTDQERAQANRRLEFLTFYHPLIRAVNHYYDAHPSEIRPVSHVRLSTTSLRPNTYAWFLFLTEITGARPAKDLECVVFSLPTADPLSPDECETLLSELAIKAENIPSSDRGRVIPDAVIAAADEILAARLEARFIERSKFNDALVATRLASLEETFKRNVGLRQERIVTARARGRRDSYIKGLETGSRNLEEAHRSRLREIESGRVLGKSFLLRGAGLVEVIRG